MKFRQALKVRNRFYAGHPYRQRTITRMRKRLRPTQAGTDHTLWFVDMISKMKRDKPIEFAALQFESAIDLISDGLGGLVREVAR